MSQILEVPVPDLGGADEVDLVEVLVAVGDLVEVELKLLSKNDYEYVLFEDLKPAGLEPVDVRSGYLPRASLPVYREMRDNRVGFFMRRLPRGVHSLSYRVRAETPGRFGALPAQAQENAGLAAALDLVLSAQSWRSLRQDQKLTVSQAQAAVETTVNALLTAYD